MKKRVGSTDRVIRIVLTILAVVLAFEAGVSTAWGIVALVVAAILLVTAISGYCPIYSLFRIDTLSIGKRTGSSHRVAH
ncbi:MAG: DUF2892 domain-containing protein [Acidimicrobiaceae bacterium]|nr:DUF2892 domain-containing protein [Acidimicrobiaceae bacterium]